MKKVILNGCFGGYGWSNHAVVDYLERQGKHLEFRRFLGYGKKDNGDTDWGSKFYAPVTREQFLAQDHANSETYLYGCAVLADGKEFDTYLDRDDEDAIALLEEKGSEYCSGAHAKLYIDEYDETLFDWSIDEYDGSENLELIPLLTEERIRACENVDAIVDLLRRMNLLRDVALSGDD